MSYKAVAFDVDGTLLDTRINIVAIMNAYHQFFPEREPLPEEHFGKCYFMTSAKSNEYLKISEQDVPAFNQLMYEKMAALSDQVSAFNGIPETVTSIKESGIMLCINTSRNAQQLNIAVHNYPMPLWSLFDMNVTSDLVNASKPAPDSLLYVMKRTGFAAGEVLFVGDSLYDGLCAQSAGCDFALAVWGADPLVEIPATYRPATPYELWEIIRSHNVKST